MKTNAARSFALLVMSVLLSGLFGCTVDFDAETIVLPDGAATRKSSLIVPDPADAEKNYVLPPGGKWEKGRRTRSARLGKTEVDTLEYRLERHYPAGAPFAADFRRKAKVSSREARNEPRLVVHDYFFLRTYQYEERFRDIVTDENFERAARNLYQEVVARGAVVLASGREDGLTALQASTAIRQVFDPLLEAFLKDVRTERLPAVLKSKKDREWSTPLHSEKSINRLMKALPAEAGRDETWRRTIAKAFDEAPSNAWDNARQTYPALEEELLGVHGFHLFSSYGFNVALSLPGEIIETNANLRDVDRLVWKFKSDDFVHGDHILRASSRLVFPERIAAAALVVLLALIGWFVHARTKRP